MNTNETFSKNLHEYVRKSGKTQTQMADIIGVSRATFSDWMHGRSLPRMNKIEALADYFGVNKADLLEEKTDTNNYYINKEVAEITQKLFDRPELRILFSASRDLSKSDIEAVTDIINRFHKK